MTTRIPSAEGDFESTSDPAEARPGDASVPGGQPPRGFRLPADTRLGPVILRIADLERSLAYYQEVLGLRLLARDGGSASLGSATGKPLVHLHEQRGVRPRPGGRTGLFHFALLLPDRGSLGRFARHLERMDVAAGAADHLVSEALYLRDPDHLGIEVYADRPRDRWQRAGRELVMTTEPLDLDDLRAAAGDEPWREMPPGTVMGHVHLTVGDLTLAGALYAEALGFDRTVWSYPGALFMAAGGYHHHLGTNVWAGRDARPPGDDEAGLLEWTLELPGAESLAAAARSVTAAGHAVDGSVATDSVSVRDPWGSTVRLTAKG